MVEGSFSSTEGLHLNSCRLCPFAALAKSTQASGFLRLFLKHSYTAQCGGKQFVLAAFHVCEPSSAPPAPSSNALLQLSLPAPSSALLQLPLPAPSSASILLSATIRCSLVSSRVGALDKISVNANIFHRLPPVQQAGIDPALASQIGESSRLTATEPRTVSSQGVRDSALP